MPGLSQPIVHVKPRFGKVVLMLVDALRSDFLFGNESEFKFVHSLLESNKAIPFTAIASAPTVTLPRLKALTTGTVPGFLDAILNIAESDQSSTLANQDNWVAQLARSPSQRLNAIYDEKLGVTERRKIGFYGDDTWIKLFPGLFSRTDGTSSFFAMDTVEVDHNVTRHVKPELSKDDWDGLIFHYLGLDHVGHSGGPKSALMRPKQEEMDSVAETIYKILTSKDSIVDATQQKELPTLFILCGDHGMNEVGNHGGSSRSEISTSFLFMSPAFESSNSQGIIKSMIDPYRQMDPGAREEYEYYRSVSQVDLVPTLSILMGLPIPKNSIGKIIPELLYDLSESEKIRALQLNSHQVAGVLKGMWPDFETESSVILKDVKNINHVSGEQLKGDDLDGGLLKCHEEPSQKQELACYYKLALENHALFIEANGDEMDSSHRAQYTVQSKLAENAYSKFLEEANSMLSTALSKYDMPLLTNGSLIMAFAVAGFFFCAMQTNLLGDFKASCLRPNFEPSYTNQSHHQKNPEHDNLILSGLNRTHRRSPNDVNWIGARVLSIVILILYLITLFASSFVEEEHQFWYFFNMTWWVVLGFTSAHYLGNTSETTGLNPSLTAAGCCLSQMIILRLLRSWNQTGQKYADQIDLRHYLNSSWTGISWGLFWITMFIMASSMISRLYRIHPLFGTNSSPLSPELPVWKSNLIGVIQALSSILIILVSLWITVYKMDLETPFFGEESMSQVHQLMSTLSTVGYTYIPENKSLVMSGYEMARSCYVGLGAIIVLSLCLKQLAGTNRLNPASTDFGPRPQAMWITNLRQINTNQKVTTTWKYEKSQPDPVKDGDDEPSQSYNHLLRSANIRTLPGQSSIHSCTIILWTLSSFFIMGNSNSIASIDISNAYVGIQAYNIILTGVLTYISNWAGPIWWCVGAVKIMLWDLELEVAWAKQDKALQLQQDEERSWRNVGGWKREDKSTLTRKTKRKIQLYKHAIAKRQEAEEALKKQKDKETEHSQVAEDQGQLSEQSHHREEKQDSEGICNGNLDDRSIGDTLEDHEVDEAFYVYEEDNIATTEESTMSALSDVPCAIVEPKEFYWHLAKTRILDHLIITSTFFGMTLYALSIAAIVLRHHLFIWTVFSPKVLYQFAWTILYQIVIQVFVVGCGVWFVVS
ncbi:major facilitator super transporter protein [Entomortierella beljakovae]|nr:major facilitator super transporter protein [Entomortierella beljakovae]